MYVHVEVSVSVQFLGVCGTSTFEGYLMPNPVYTHTLNI